MKKSLLFLLIFLSSVLNASDFTIGSGSNFNMKANGVSSKLSIYVAESSFTRLGIEYYFISSGLFSTKKMWQQYTLGINNNGPLDIHAGYIKTPELSKPESLTSEYLNVNKGVKLDQFLFSKKSDLDKYKIGTERVEVPAGTIETVHYRKENNGQVVDFWISDKVKPIGLVKLISKNPKELEQNYELELMSLLRNIKAEINPKEAVPLTEKGKSVLATPHSKKK